MTKKHFQAFAESIRLDLKHAAYSGGDVYEQAKRCATYAAVVFADIAQRENGRFDRDRFMTACGL